MCFQYCKIVFKLTNLEIIFFLFLFYCFNVSNEPKLMFLFFNKYTIKINVSKYRTVFSLNFFQILFLLFSKLNLNNFVIDNFLSEDKVK